MCEKREKLEALAASIRSRSDWWIFPTQEPIQGFFGTGPVFIVGDQPSSDEWPPEHPNRKAFYETLQKVRIPNAHLTDFYKKRGKCSELQERWLRNPPPDFPLHLEILLKEIEAVNQNEL